MHLGYEESQHTQFEAFLDSLIQKNETITHFVILGDFVDMWRRDVSGIFLTSNNIVSKIMELNKKIIARTKDNNSGVHGVFGNHDHHLRFLAKDDYPLHFQKELDLTDKGITYHFKHGHQFDLLQNPVLIELLCYNLNDNLGHIRSEFWDTFQSMIKNLKGLFKINENRKEFLLETLNFPKTKSLDLADEELESHLDDYIKKLEPDAMNLAKYLVTPAKERLEPSNTIELEIDSRSPVNLFGKKGPNYDQVEKNAYHNDNIKNGKRLVFGHTHKPFVSSDCLLANSGSWVGTEDIHNTYLEIDGNDIRLMQYDSGPINDDPRCKRNFEN